MAAAVTTMAQPPSMPTTTTISASTASAEAIAAASSSKHRPPNLPTPKSGTYPSSINSPLIPTPNHLKKEESLKTPVTPPSAYLDFLNKLSPNIKSPLSTSQSTTFSFTAGLPRSPANFAYPPAPASARPVLTSNPSNSSVESTASSRSNSTASSTGSAQTTQSAPAANTSRPVTCTTVDVPRAVSTGPKTAPIRAEGPIRRPSLKIPPSPSTTVPSVISPSSARLRSPLSAGAAAKAYYTSGSPIGWEQALSAGAGKTRPVCVKEVVTRTMTYTRPRASTAGGQTDSPSVSFPPPAPKGEDLSTKSIIKEEEPEEERGAGNAILEENETEQNVASKQGHRRRPLVGEAPKGKRRKVDTDT